MAKKIAFQGALGAYSDMACRAAMPECEPYPCQGFTNTIEAVQKGEAEYGMIPVDNSLAGRVPAIHLLLPESGLHIIGEYFLPVHHCLLGVKGTTLESIREVRSHLHALPQCQKLIRERGYKEHVSPDTAKAAEEVASLKDTSIAAISSALAAELYDLEIVAENIEDESYNKTRFLIVSKEPLVKPELKEGARYVTTILFRVRNIPAALYKALGGFATNSVNMTKLESYMVGGTFMATQFYLDVEGHPDQPAVRRALEELEYFAAELNILGIYQAHPYREEQKKLISDLAAE